MPSGFTSMSKGSRRACSTVDVSGEKAEVPRPWYELCQSIGFASPLSLLLPLPLPFPLPLPAIAAIAAAAAPAASGLPVAGGASGRGSPDTAGMGLRVATFAIGVLAYERGGTGGGALEVEAGGAEDGGVEDGGVEDEDCG